MTLPHPRLLFSDSELPELRRRIATGTRSRVHLDLAMRNCERYVDPASPQYFDFKERKSAIWHERNGNFVIPCRLLTLALVGHVAQRPEWIQTAAEALMTLIRERVAERGLGDYKNWRTAGHDAGKYCKMIGLGYDLTWPYLDEAARRDVHVHVCETLAAMEPHARVMQRLIDNNQGGKFYLGMMVMTHAVRDELDQPLPYGETTLTRAGWWLSKILRLNYDHDGAPLEGHSYGSTTMLFATVAAHILAREGVADWLHDQRIANFADYCVYETCYPEGWINDFGDSHRRDMGQSVYYAAVAGRKPVCLWLWDRFCRDGAHPMSSLRAMTEKQDMSQVPWLLLWPDDQAVAPLPPEQCGYPKARHFRGRGLVTLRSGFDVQALHATMHSGEIPHNYHSQADQNQVTVTALDRRWLIDSSYSFQDEVTGKSVVARDSEAHNNVHVDGIGQMHKNSDGGWPSGRIVWFAPSDDQAYVMGDAREAYPSNCRLLRADRHLLCVHRSGIDPYAIWLDDYLAADGKIHDYTLTLHAAPDCRFERANEGLSIVASDASLDLHPMSPTAISYESGSYGGHPTMRLTVRDMRGRFALLLHPRREGIDKAKVSVEWSADAVEFAVRISGVEQRHKIDTAERRE